MNLFSHILLIILSPGCRKLGITVADRNKVLADVIIAVRDMKLSQDFQNNKNDTFGDTYEFLMSMYAANAGKSGGEFFTPQEVSEILVRLATYDNDKIDSVYDPACGSGSLLMKFQKIIGKKNPNLKYYGQEINPTTFNLCRINMFLHNVNYNNFNIALGDTLLNPAHRGMEFDAIVSNPPYSLKWVGKDSPILINDQRYAPAGVLAPKSAADLAFTMHMFSLLKETGICAIVEFPGVLYRGGAEKQIRELRRGSPGKYTEGGIWKNEWIVCPPALMAATPVGASTTIFFLFRSHRWRRKVVFPVPALPVRNIDLLV